MGKKFTLSRIRIEDGAFELPEGAIILGYEVRNEIKHYQRDDGTMVSEGGDRHYITIASPEVSENG